MENVFEYLPDSIIALIVEFVVFFGFVHFASAKTKSEVSRRWKAAALISVCCGLLSHLLVSAILVLSWFFDKNIGKVIVELPNLLITFFAQAIVIGAMVTMPMVILVLFLAYFSLWQTGDRLVEQFWRNPKIHYDENNKPPFLKL